MAYSPTWCCHIYNGSIYAKPVKIVRASMYDWPDNFAIGSKLQKVWRVLLLYVCQTVAKWRHRLQTPAFYPDRRRRGNKDVCSNVHLQACFCYYYCYLFSLLLCPTTYAQRKHFIAVYNSPSRVPSRDKYIYVTSQECLRISMKIAGSNHYHERTD